MIENPSVPELNHDNIEDVSEHILQMQEKYDFKSDQDSIVDSVFYSSSLLNIILTEQEAQEVMEKVLQSN
jgi:uncharacterized protein (DUF2225 family)